MAIPLQVTIEEMYRLVGEQYTLRYKLEELAKAQAEEIERLREQLNGKLEQSSPHNAIRPVLSGVQGEGRRRDNLVLGRSNESTDGSSENVPSGIGGS